MPRSAIGHSAPGPRRRALALLALGLVAIALAMLAAGCGGGGSDTTSATETQTETTEPTDTTETTETTASGEVEGAAVFESADCGSCHTLTAAGTSGVAGPNLDNSTLSQAQIAEQVVMPSGPMPSFADQLSDAEVQAVAKYVFDSRVG